MLLYLHNRAFQYNDGFFDTLMVQNGAIRFWNDHQERMRQAARALQLELPEELLAPGFKDAILTLATRNNAHPLARVKLRVWRAGAGLFTPEINTAEWVATARPTSPLATSPLTIGICKSVQTCFSPFSFFKGPNALLYVMAGISKKEQKRDDMLLLDQHGHVAELISSNIFWLSDNILYTPALETGCVRGIMRSNVIRWAKEAGLQITETRATPEVLLQADAVFATNVTGIRIIHAVEHKILADRHAIVDQLQQKLKTVSHA